MRKIHTHYDNLKVARSAPFEVIQAAYRALSLKFHPDHNPDDPEAARIMALINAAYAVLSDPSKRAEHDQWIARQEGGAAQAAASSPSWAQSAKQSASGQASAQASGQGFSGQASGRASAEAGQDFREPGKAPGPASDTANGRASGRATGNSFSFAASFRRYWIFLLIGALVAGKLWWTGRPRPVSPVQNQEQQALAQKRPSMTYRATAQGGAAEPAAPAEPAVPATPAAPAASATPSPNPESEPSLWRRQQTAATGRCRVVMDNRQGGTPLVARLVRLEDGRGEVVREFAVAARGEVNVQNVPPGIYEVRYRNPSTGVSRKTEPFALRETRTPDGGVRSDVFTFTTYSVSDGNMRTTPIREGEF